MDMCTTWTVTVEIPINMWLAVLSVHMCYKMLLENVQEMEQNAHQQRE